MLARITVHGRFQPPLHINHWRYIQEAFNKAHHVQILITNPFNNETLEITAVWRSNPDNNPFTYQERVEMFCDFFNRMGIESDRYSFRPFNITDEESFKQLDSGVPNLVNVYSEWSAKKVRLFAGHGLAVMQLRQPNTKNISGMAIRELIRQKNVDGELAQVLIEAGFMEEAVPALLRMLQKSSSK